MLNLVFGRNNESMIEYASEHNTGMLIVFPEATRHPDEHLQLADDLLLMAVDHDVWVVTHSEWILHRVKGRI